MHLLSFLLPLRLCAFESCLACHVAHQCGGGSRPSRRAWSSGQLLSASSNFGVGLQVNVGCIWYLAEGSYCHCRTQGVEFPDRRKSGTRHWHRSIRTPLDRTPPHHHAHHALTTRAHHTTLTHTITVAGRSLIHLTICSKLPSYTYISWLSVTASLGGRAQEGNKCTV